MNGDTRPCPRSFSHFICHAWKVSSGYFGSCLRCFPWVRSLDHPSCLTTAFVKIFSRVRAVLSFFVLMKETWGENKLRLVKEEQTRELRQRTAARLAELRAVSTGIATDVEEKGTQCNDWTPCLNACLFCFLLVVANLLFLQWLYTKRVL